jgi:hypothetical protein
MWLHGVLGRRRKYYGKVVIINDQFLSITSVDYLDNWKLTLDNSQL